MGGVGPQLRTKPALAAFLETQVAAGASAVQLFDSWAGALTPQDYRDFVMPYSASVLSRVGELGVPRIHFGVNTASLLGLMGEAGADIVGVDWRTPLADGIARVGDRGVQGNLDPTLLLGPTGRMFHQAEEILRRVGGRPGHIFNLGHGILPSTPVEHVQMLAQYVHSTSRRFR